MIAAPVSRGDLIRYVLAVIGLHMAFMPLLVLLLPRRVEALFGPLAGSVLSQILLVGAVTAGLAHIAAGHLGDRWVRARGHRRGLIGIGLAAVTVSYALLASASDYVDLLIAILAFQVSLNLCLSPTMALLADHVGDGQKGAVGGWLGAALPLSTLGAGIIGLLFRQDSSLAFLVIAGLVIAMVAPLLIWWRLAPVAPQPNSEPARSGKSDAEIPPTLALLWLARLVVQTAGSFLLFYLFLFVSALVSSDPAWAGRDPTLDLAGLSVVGAAAATIGAIGSGVLSDRLGSRRGPMAVAALALGAALLLLATAPAPLPMAAGLALFQFGLCAYLAVDMAWVAALVARSPRRGAILGIMNLSNTIPALIAPLFAWAMLGAGGLQALLSTAFAVCGILAIVTALAVSRLRGSNSAVVPG